MSTEVAVKPAIESTGGAYCCPGETQPISHSIHLGRLARFYAGCLECPHRAETGDLSAQQSKQIEQWTSRRRDQLTFVQDVVQGGYPDHLGPRQARPIAAAFAEHVRDSSRSSSHQPSGLTILVASDGSAMTSDVQSALIEGLQFAGCDVVDVGLVTASVIAASVADMNVDGGVFISGATNPTPRVELRLFASGGKPLSAGASLDEVEQRYAIGVARSSRTAGGLRREQVAGDYLRGMRRYFHALRPLRFVLQTTSHTLRQYVDTLTADVGCTSLGGSDALPLLSDAFPLAQEAVAEQFLACQADFGIWIDAAGQSCQIVDERGQPVSPRDLMSLLCPATQLSVLDKSSAPDNAEQQYASLVESIAPGAVDTARRLWLVSPMPVVDGLLVLARLLTRLSQSDRSLSAVLAESHAKR